MYSNREEPPGGSVNKPLLLLLLLLLSSLLLIALKTLPYIGMCIIDLSKTLMYDFHHNILKRCITTKQDYFSPTQTV